MVTDEQHAATREALVAIESMVATPGLSDSVRNVLSGAALDLYRIRLSEEQKLIAQNEPQ